VIGAAGPAVATATAERMPAAAPTAAVASFPSARAALAVLPREYRPATREPMPAFAPDG